MTVSISGNTDHVHSPCERCGYGTRFKQFPIRCLCNRNCSKEELKAWPDSPIPHGRMILRGKNESVRSSSGWPSTSGINDRFPAAADLARRLPLPQPVPSLRVGYPLQAMAAATLRVQPWLLK